MPVTHLWWPHASRSGHQSGVWPAGHDRNLVGGVGQQGNRSSQTTGVVTRPEGRGDKPEPGTAAPTTTKHQKRGGGEEAGHTHWGQLGGGWSPQRGLFCACDSNLKLVSVCYNYKTETCFNKNITTAFNSPQFFQINSLLTHSDTGLLNSL